MMRVRRDVIIIHDFHRGFAFPTVICDIETLFEL